MMGYQLGTFDNISFIKMVSIISGINHRNYNIY